MYFVIILITFTVFLTMLQNSMPLTIKFLTWNLQMPLAVLVLASSLFGGSIIALISWPKVIKANLAVKRLKKEIVGLRKKPDGSK